MEKMLAVVVLYRMRAEQSPAFVSLRRALAQRGQRRGADADADADADVDVMLCDNTPWEQAAPEGFEGVYLRDTANPGLAACFNAALGKAAVDGCSWLMLLDQDTEVTDAYVEEVCCAAAAASAEVVALVPKLVERGVICSPAALPVLGVSRAVGIEAVGVSERRLFPFNSGAVLRVSALRAMGGFPAEFPLDYLDHAMFAELQARGGRVQVLRSALEHELSSNTERAGAAAARRQASVLAAERRFYARYGTPAQRWLRRLRLLKAAAGRLLRGKEAGQTWRMLKSALWP
jgi:GT2 family glycosyltransferase